MFLVEPPYRTGKKRYTHRHTTPRLNRRGSKAIFQMFVHGAVTDVKIAGAQMCNCGGVLLTRDCATLRIQYHHRSALRTHYHRRWTLRIHHGHRSTLRIQYHHRSMLRTHYHRRWTLLSFYLISDWNQMKA